MKVEVEKDFEMVAKTIFGLEDILCDELLRIGARDIIKHNRAVTFTGDIGFMYKANISLRTALRILIPIEKFTIKNEQSLYDAIQKINWDEFINVNDTLAIDTVLNTDLFNHSQYISQKAKDAIVDQFRDKYDERPSVDFDNPTIRIHLHIFNDTLSIALDSSGNSLHKRGYRDKTNLAPINEVLAAGMVLLSGWDKRSNFIDPMCGSGTLLIEAAMIANNIPPGYYREQFGFENWNKFMPFDEVLFNTILDAAIDRINDNNPKIIGCEISKNVAKKAKENVKLAKVNDVIEIRTCDMTAIDDLPVGRGVVVMNPPYGERMVKDDMEVLYKSIGDTFKNKFTGYDCWVISSNMDALKRIGLRPSRKITLFNGSLECKFMKYEMYKGTKKIHKLENTNNHK